MSILAAPLRALLVGIYILASFAPTAHADPRRRADIWVKYDDVPRRVREVIERERGRREIKQILEIRIDGKVYFRTLIDERGADRVLLVSEGGRIVKVSEVPDLAVGEGSFEKWIRYDDLPRDVRRTLDRERGRYEVKVISFVRRDNREFYRCIIDTKGDDLAVRINSVGKLLSVDEVDDVSIGLREISRHDYDRERSMRYDDIPREVRVVVERQYAGRPVKQVVYVERNGRRFYRCIIDDRGSDRVLRVGDDGYLYEEREVQDIAVGAGGYDANRFGHEATMRQVELPWEVAQTLERERRGRPVKEILYVRRGAYTFYRCVIDTRGDDVALRISDSGRVLSREEVDDVSFGKDEIEYGAAREEWVKYATLPRPAQVGLERYRRGHDVLKIIRIEYRGRVTYRCTIDSRPWASTLRIDEAGRILGEE
ncbi:MAG: hypothetical protein JWN40_4424 [Phycisphaerales bacterium]|nr:hypothetical protein [Phycisphaerales bacterium]